MITEKIIKALFIGVAIGYFLRHTDIINKLRIKFGIWNRERKDMKW